MSINIPATLENFKTQIPMLNRFEMEATERGRQLRFAWKNLSIMGQPNWASFYTNKNDEKLSQIVVCIGLNKNNEIKKVESVTLAYKIIEVASGQRQFIKKFKQWVNTIIHDETGKKQFGKILVKFIVAKNHDGAVVLLIIGD